MFSGGDEDVSKYGDVDSDEKIRERLVSTNIKAAQEEIIKILSKKICELQEEMGIKDCLPSELQLPAKWYENIPEHGVLCWERRDVSGVYKKIVTVYKYHEHYGFLTAFYWVHKSASVIPLTNAEIEEFKR